MWIADVYYTFCVTHFVKSKIVCKFVGRKALTQVSNVKMFHSKFYPSVSCPSGCVPAPLLGAHFASVFRKSSPMGELRKPRAECQACENPSPMGELRKPRAECQAFENPPLWAHCASREQNVKLSKIPPLWANCASREQNVKLAKILP